MLPVDMSQALALTNSYLSTFQFDRNSAPPKVSHDTPRWETPEIPSAGFEPTIRSGKVENSAVNTSKHRTTGDNTPPAATYNFKHLGQPNS